MSLKEKIGKMKIDCRNFVKKPQQHKVISSPKTMRHGDQLKEIIISDRTILENLRRVECGQELTIPLAVLSDKFKEKYRRMFGEFERFDAEELRIRSKEWKINNKERVKKRCQKYYVKNKEKLSIQHKLNYYLRKIKHGIDVEKNRN